MYFTRLTVRCGSDFTEILIAEIGEAGFDTFMETENGFEAYAEEENFDRNAVQDIRLKYQNHTSLHFAFDQVEKKNWNEEWERSYEPIVVEGACMIRAEFHIPEKKYPHEIIITPKMSFGTGHHQTTYLMIQAQMQIDHQGKRVMDAGCGTAVLAIMASKLGATEVEAFDIDEWSVVNGNENAQINHAPNVHIRQGKISQLHFEGVFDIILANINKNILLEEMPAYVTFLRPGGTLLISGFYENDIPDLLKAAQKLQLHEKGRFNKETWAALWLNR